MTSTAEHFRRELDESNSWIHIAMEASGDTLATSTIRQVIQSGATIVTAGMGGSLGLAMTTSSQLRNAGLLSFALTCTDAMRLATDAAVFAISCSGLSYEFVRLTSSRASLAVVGERLDLPIPTLVVKSSGSLLRPVSFYVGTAAIFSKLIGNASPSAMAEAWSLPSKSSDWIREITEKTPANASLVLLGDEDTHGARYAGAAYLTERTHYSVHILHIDEFRHIALLGPPRDAFVIGTWQDAERFSAKSRISALQRGYSLYEPFVAQSYSDIVSHNFAVKRFLIELCLAWMVKHGDVGYVDCPVTWE